MKQTNIIVNEILNFFPIFIISIFINFAIFIEKYTFNIVFNVQLIITKIALVKD